MKDCVEVVAALIWNNDRFMICKRPPHKARANKWEFVGGKVELNESKEQALIRECQEELDVLIEINGIFTDVVHAYTDLKVHLTLFNAKIKSGIPKLIEHSDLKWIKTSEISKYDFCDADYEILDLIKNTYN